MCKSVHVVAKQLCVAVSLFSLVSHSHGALQQHSSLQPVQKLRYKITVFNAQGPKSTVLTVIAGRDWGYCKIGTRLLCEWDMRLSRVLMRNSLVPTELEDGLNSFVMTSNPPPVKTIVCDQLLITAESLGSSEASGIAVREAVCQRFSTARSPLKVPVMVREMKVKRLSPSGNRNSPFRQLDLEIAGESDVLFASISQVDERGLKNSPKIHLDSSIKSGIEYSEAAMTLLGFNGGKVIQQMTDSETSSNSK